MKNLFLTFALAATVSPLWANTVDFGNVLVPTAGELQKQNFSFDTEDLYLFTITADADIFGSVIRNAYNPAAFGSLLSLELVNRDTSNSLGFVDLGKAIFDNGETKQSGYSFHNLVAGNYQFVASTAKPTNIGQNTNYYLKLNTTNPSPVPEPTAVWLLVCGLGAMGMARKLKKT
jgi:hypothetical protein